MRETHTPTGSSGKVGDRVLVAHVATRAWPVVQGVLRRILGAHDPDYEDTLQTSLERIVETFQESMLADGSLARWAAVVTRNVAVDVLRARVRERRLLTLDDGTISVRYPTWLDPERVASARERLADVQRGLGRLRAGNAQVVYMHDVLGCELIEIAAVLGISVAAAQSRLVRGRRYILPPSMAQSRSTAPRRPSTAVAC